MTPIGNPARDTHAPPALWEELERRGYLPNQAQCRRCMIDMQRTIEEQFAPKFAEIQRRLDQLAEQRAENARHIADMAEKIDKVFAAFNVVLQLNPEKIETVAEAAAKERINQAKMDDDRARRKETQDWLKAASRAFTVAAAIAILGFLLRLAIVHPEIIK